MRVAIVGKTHMGNAICVGGLATTSEHSVRSVRLLKPGGLNQPPETPYEIGEVWDLDYCDSPDIVPPHIEDVIVRERARVGRIRDLRSWLMKVVQPWEGWPDKLYDGLVHATSSGSGYVSRRTGVPMMSTGFWTPDRALTRSTENDRTRYRYPSEVGVRCLTYVGVAESIERIPSRTLLRVSLARWWRPDDAPDMEERCYLQLSGWFL